MTILNVTSKTTEQHLILHCNSTFRFRFRPYWGSWSASGCQISSKSDHPQWRYDVISIFKMAADAAQFYFPFQISWRRFFRISVSISKPNFVANSVRGWDINFCFRKTNVRQIGNLHPVSILTISLQSACHSAPVCEILSKSDSPRQ